MLISIKNRDDVFYYEFNSLVKTEGYAQGILHEYYINPESLCSFKICENLEHSFSFGGVGCDECRKSIVLNFGGTIEVLAFEDSAVGEYHRIKRELLEHFEDKSESVSEVQSKASSSK
ncbi:hypothetical protein [Endozoicomonas sp. ALD040]|uniref:hypothetical protein n=1 Tax=Endozoicomonas sp. ALD040 TaxID=3403079 RepID=UPI003BB10AC7